MTPSRVRPPRIIGAFLRTGDGTFEGHAFETGDPARVRTVALWLDGVMIARLRADGPRAGAATGDPTAFRGFAYAAPPERLHGHRHLTARLADRGQLIAPPIDLRETPIAEPAEMLPGLVAWSSGRLTGWVRDGAAAKVVARIGAETVAETVSDPWTLHARPFGALNDRRAFTLALPQRLADGHEHKVTVTDGAERALLGSPVACRVPAL